MGTTISVVNEAMCREIAGTDRHKLDECILQHSKKEEDKEPEKNLEVSVGLTLGARFDSKASTGVQGGLSHNLFYNKNHLRIGYGLFFQGYGDNIGQEDSGAASNGREGGILGTAGPLFGAYAPVSKNSSIDFSFGPVVGFKHRRETKGEPTGRAMTLLAAEPNPTVARETIEPASTNLVYGGMVSIGTNLNTIRLSLTWEMLATHKVEDSIGHSLSLGASFLF